MNYLVALAFIAILASLASALFFMLRGSSGESKDGKRKASNMARAPAIWRARWPSVSGSRCCCSSVSWLHGSLGISSPRASRWAN